MAPMKRPSPSRVEGMTETLSLETAARRLHISRKKVRQLLGAGELDFVQIRGRFRVPRASLEQFLTKDASAAATSR